MTLKVQLLNSWIISKWKLFIGTAATISIDLGRTGCYFEKMLRSDQTLQLCVEEGIWALADTTDDKLSRHL